MLRYSLFYYFSVDSLRDKEVVSALRTMLLPRSEVMVSFNPSPSALQVAEPLLDAPETLSYIQPMKAALYFDGAEGFGDWRIQISSKAEKHLRAAKRADSKLFDIIVKKIRELSKGHFSDDNQKRLNGPKTGVPVFEAKMTRDTRLVVAPQSPFII
jgi:hypothetical protein